eukprot:107393-Rhodomonas_salina.2
MQRTIAGMVYQYVPKWMSLRYLQSEARSRESKEKVGIVKRTLYKHSPKEVAREGGRGRPRQGGGGVRADVPVQHQDPLWQPAPHPSLFTKKLQHT